MMRSSYKIIVLITALLLSPLSMAKEDNQYLLTEKTYKALNIAQELMAQEQLTAAEDKLKSLLKQVKQDSYEMALVRQTLAYLYSTKEDYSQATKQFQLALDTNALPEKVSHNLKYNLAQLLIADERYSQGIALLEQWIKAENSPANSAYVLLASANYRQQNYKKTVTAIRIAIKNDSSAQESWYQLLLSAHLELKQYQSAIKVLETLLPQYPYKKTYWMQLSSLYLQQNKEFTALAVKMLSQRLELGDGKTLINMADMYRYLHIPYKSAKLLTNAIDKGIIKADFDNLNRLGDSWLAAKEGEKAALVLIKIAKIDGSGQSDLKLGRVYFNLEQWDNADNALHASLVKLSAHKQGPVFVLLGMSQFHLGNLSQAKTHFSNAIAFNNEKKQAGQWLRHIEAQLKIENNNKS